MAEEKINALGAKAAYNLADVTKTKPQYGALTPKWITKLLEFKGLEAGIYRVNRVKEGDTPLDVLCSATKKSDIVPQGFVEYEEQPREYRLNSISTIININTQIEDVYSSTTMITACSKISRILSVFRRETARRLPMTLTSLSQRFGKSRPSSSRTRERLPHLKESARSAEYRP